MNEYLMAFSLGLLSTPHCVAMCGSLAGALLMGSRATGPRQSPLGAVFLFGSGKLLAYTALGGIAGLGGMALAGTMAWPGMILRALSALLMTGIGLYISGWWKGISQLEAAGARLWQPLLRQARTLQLEKSGNKILAGMAWGLLPCGIVYSMLGMALATSDMLRGALLMASFGLGTMPFVMSAGGVMKALLRVLDKPLVRQLAGTAMILMGIAALLMLAMPAAGGHEH